MGKLRALRLVLVIGALAFLAILLRRLGFARIAEELASVGIGGLWVLAAYCAATAVGAFPWYVLLERRDRPSLRATVASRFAASGATATLPMFGVSGEPVRLLWMRPDQRAGGVAALIVDRLSYGVASALFLVLGVAVAVSLAAIPDELIVAAIAGAIALLAVAGVGAWLVARRRVVTWLHHLARRLRKRTHTDGAQFGEQIDHELHAMIDRRRSLALAVLIGLVARILFAVEVYVGFLVLGEPVSAAEAIVFASVPVVLAFLGTVVPGQLGIQEGTQAFIAGALGIPPVTAVALVLLQRVRTIVIAVVGWLLVAIRR